MRFVATVSIFAGLILSSQAAVLPDFVSATPAPTPADKSTSALSAGPTPAPSLQRRCEENESCSDFTVGPEVPIAVTTTMMTTKLVPCTTTTTVINSQTTTLTLWSTEIQTSTEHVQGASTVTVWLVTPAPEIKSKTWLQEETLTFVRTGTETSYWTETKPVQTSMLTVAGPTTTWTDGGEPAPTACHECGNPAPTSTQAASQIPVQQPAWTQTTAIGSVGTPVINPVGGGAPATGPQASSAAIGWVGNPQALGSGASSPSPLSTVPGGAGQPFGNSATAPGIAQYNSTGTTGVPIQSGSNSTAHQSQGAANSPFVSNASSSHISFGSSNVLLVGTLFALLCSAMAL